MAINSTRGLPSFSEMYTAFKNKGSLGESLQAGIEGYKTGDTMRRADLAQQSQSELEKQQAAKAKHDAETPKEQFIRLDQITDPKELATLEPQSQIQPETGLKVVPLSVYNSINKQRLNTETLELKAEMAQTKAEKDNRIAELIAENQAVRADLGGEGLRQKAAASIISGLPSEPPGAFEKFRGGTAKVAGKIASKLPMVSTTTAAGIESALTPQAIEDAKIRQGAIKVQKGISEGGQRLNALNKNAQGDITDKALAIQELTNAGLPITEANIVEALKQLKGK